MRFPWTIGVAMASGLAISSIPPGYGTPVHNKWTVHEEGIVKQRLATIDLPFEVQNTDVVLERVRMYTNGGRRQTSAIIGRSEVYFPIYEHYLRKYNLPAELKYLPIIESGLRSDIHSGAGAAGMWQLMPSTANHYGLIINDYLDERRDPYRSTEAAVKFLADLYDMFGDWALVLAAYNGGHNRVQRAIEQADCNEYEAVRDLLPKETQRYIPYFIAAAYIANYHDQHGITPRQPSPGVNSRRMIEVHQYVSFWELANATGLSYSTISDLNPAFLQGAVPRSQKGCYLVLPEGSTEAARALLRKKAAGKDQNGTHIPANSFQYFHIVTPTDDIEKLAVLFQCTAADIVAWNNLSGTEIIAGQELCLYLSKAYLFNRA